MLNEYLLEDQNASHNGDIYNIKKIVDFINANNVKITELKVEKLKHQLYEECWGDGKDIKYSPIDALNNKTKNKDFTEHYNRAINSDLSFPIIYNRKYECITDGMHRLLKAYIQGNKTIKAYMLDQIPDSCKS